MAYRCRNDADWTMYYVSEGAQALTGYSASQLVQSAGVSFNEVIHPEDRGRVWNDVQKALAQRQPFQLTYRIQPAGGGEKWVMEKGRGVWSDAGELEWLEGFITDITNLKEVEFALLEKDRLLTNASHFARFGGWSVNLKDRRVKWSEEIRLLHGAPPGFSPTAAEGINFYAPESRARITEVFDLCAKTGQPYDEELEIINAKGERIAVRTAGFAVRNRAGEIVEVQGFFQDISQQKQAEKVQRDLEHRLLQAQKAESLGRMAGAIAHHFNNQLQSVLGNLELAISEMTPDSLVLPGLKDALNAGHKAAELSHRMLTYLGQEFGRHEVVELKALFSQALDVLRVAAPAPAKIVLELEAGVACVKGDAHQLQQVLTNILTNAWESLGGERGLILIKLFSTTAAGVPSEARFPADWVPSDGPLVCLEVQDDGCGMGKVEIESVFDPFFTTKFTGRGMGLPVALGVVRAMGGVITVESEIGKGTIVRVFLPVSVEPLAGVSGDFAPVEQQRRTAKPSLLVVDDDQDFRSIARVMLARIGCDVSEACSGEEAVKIVQAGERVLDGVICDLSMPGMDGWRTLEELRKLMPQIPVILASGYDQDRAFEGEHKELPQAFLHKPFQLVQLRETVEQLFPASQQKM